MLRPIPADPRWTVENHLVLITKGAHLHARHGEALVAGGYVSGHHDTDDTDGTDGEQDMIEVTARQLAIVIDAAAELLAAHLTGGIDLTRSRNWAALVTDALDRYIPRP